MAALFVSGVNGATLHEAKACGSKAELNCQKDQTGRPYRFALSTRAQEGIVLPPDVV